MKSGGSCSPSDVSSDDRIGGRSCEDEKRKYAATGEREEFERHEAQRRDALFIDASSRPDDGEERPGAPLVRTINRQPLGISHRALSLGGNYPPGSSPFPPPVVALPLGCRRATEVWAIPMRDEQCARHGLGGTTCSRPLASLRSAHSCRAANSTRALREYLARMTTIKSAQYWMHLRRPRSTAWPASRAHHDTAATRSHSQKAPSEPTAQPGSGGATTATSLRATVMSQRGSSARRSRFQSHELRGRANVRSPAAP